MNKTDNDHIKNFQEEIKLIYDKSLEDMKRLWKNTNKL